MYTYNVLELRPRAHCRSHLVSTSSDVLQHWIAFQLLHAVAQSHEQGICHGDIKCENVLVTSWHWILLADFASYKPAYLPADNPVRHLCIISVLLAIRVL